MTLTLQVRQTELYDNYGFKLLNFTEEKDGKMYQACHFNLNNTFVHSRLSKITPKKIGQFVTFWKRNKNGITEPFKEEDNFDFLIINVNYENRYGQFIFPKSTLIKQGIISTITKEGKRGFRVYPIWDITESKQAIRTQKWQLNFFKELIQNTNKELINNLYLIK